MPENQCTKKYFYSENTDGSFVNSAADEVLIAVNIEKYY
jgi:hypothetical protein